MARQVITWCDRCLDRGDHKAATERRIGIGTQWWSADLDDDCAAELLDPLAKLIVNAGRPSEFQQRKTQRVGTLVAGVDPMKFPPPTYEPRPADVTAHKANLERRAKGIRLGRKSFGLQTPCIFCGMHLSGTNVMHIRVHGFTKISEALGGHCPWCGITSGQLGSHLLKSHEEHVHRTAPVDVGWEILKAHVEGAPFDRLEDIRARAYNTEPLSVVVAAIEECEETDA